jgi:ATP-binding cassette subfamily F protein uup
VVVSHDRELLDRLCTEVIGLDGRGGSAWYGNVSQWLSAYERATTPRSDMRKARIETNPKCEPRSTKSKKLNYREQQELEQMEASILAAEESVVARQAEVEHAATAGHMALTEACRRLEESQRTVETLYSRWQELELKRGT